MSYATIGEDFAKAGIISEELHASETGADDEPGGFDGERAQLFISIK